MRDPLLLGSCRYDGYRLTYMGYDFLAIRALTARGHIAGVGRQIGVGKESDIFEVGDWGQGHHTADVCVRPLALTDGLMLEFEAGA
jgi:RIO-like serine/threonine protein kinase